MKENKKMPKGKGKKLSLVLAAVVLVAVGFFTLRADLFQGFIFKSTRYDCEAFEKDANKYISLYEAGELSERDLAKVEEVIIAGKDNNCSGEAYWSLYRISQELRSDDYNADRPLNRCQFAKIIVESLDLEINTDRGPHFTDVAEESWCYPFAETAYNNGILSGYPDGRFGGSDSVNRAEAIKVVVDAFDLAVCTYTEKVYDDVSLEAWFADDVSTAVHWGLIEVAEKLDPNETITKSWLENVIKNAENAVISDPEGYLCGGGTLGEEISKAEFAKKLVLKAALIGVIDENPSFSDVKVDDYYYPYVEIANASEAMEGYGNGTFGPQNNLNRSEVVKIAVDTFELDRCEYDEDLFEDVNPLDWYARYVASAVDHGLLCASSAEDCALSREFMPGTNATEGFVDFVLKNARRAANNNSQCE